MITKFEAKLAESVLLLVTDSSYETDGRFNLVSGDQQCSSADFANLSEAQRAAI